MQGLFEFRMFLKFQKIPIHCNANLKEFFDYPVFMLTTNLIARYNCGILSSKFWTNVDWWNFFGFGLLQKSSAQEKLVKYILINLNPRDKNTFDKNNKYLFLFFPDFNETYITQPGLFQMMSNNDPFAMVGWAIWLVELLVTK